MAEEIFILAAAGAAGQIFRALAGLKKAIESGEKINTTYLIATIIGGLFIGAGAGVLMGGDWRGAFLGGYSGMDFVEGMVKKK